MVRPQFVVAAILLLSGSAAIAQSTGPASLASESPTVSESSDIGKAAIRFDLVAGDVAHRIDHLLREMTLEEKIGQLVQVYPEGDKLTDELRAKIRSGHVGSIFYPGDGEVIRQAQAIARDESRLGIPLIVARDVVHGFHTIFPIPLGQAASWNPELVQQAAEFATTEAKAEGIAWTFAPMVDICRDPRWGRVAETLGEDPMLASELAVAMVRGFQQEKDGHLNGMAACAKHFAAYGLAEGGRDYNRASLSQTDLHNVYLPPFRASIDAGCRSLMTTFSEVNGVPGTAHDELINDVAKTHWRFGGVVVSDWASISEMVNHGFVPDNAMAAKAAIAAGVDMDMCSPAFAGHLKALVQSGEVPEKLVDDAVRRVLRLKVELQPASPVAMPKVAATGDIYSTARQLAEQSLVLLKNNGVLPLDQQQLKRLAVVGPLADEPVEQLGCWSLDGNSEASITPLQHLRSVLEGKVQINYARGAKNSFATNDSLIAEAVRAAEESDAVLLLVGEDAVLSGEARSRSTLELPGVQSKLVAELSATGKPVVMVVLAGRPLAIADEVEAVDAVLYAWHPGTMAGPAIADVVLGKSAPSGKLPITFPRAVGQVPLYYSHPKTGRPAPDDYMPLTHVDEEDLPEEFQYRSHYLDIKHTPLFPFGFGLSYATFEYTELELSSAKLRPSDVLSLRVRLQNTGEVAATEVSQLYVRDRTASIVRPVRELKAFRRTQLEPGESAVLEFAVPVAKLGFFDNDGEYLVEPGTFDVWVGTDSTAPLGAEFEVFSNTPSKVRHEIALPSSRGSEASKPR
ncbi:beta-glucosidase BglX [Aeoliella sp. SH292]|uniref:beta-glucosidase BglX n=1 Tax=Aeoliella sp. SH292 TaxID=3454464 RepID=UPI003F9C23D0